MKWRDVEVHSAPGESRRSRIVTAESSIPDRRVAEDLRRQELSERLRSVERARGSGGRDRDHAGCDGEAIALGPETRVAGCTNEDDPVAARRRSDAHAKVEARGRRDVLGEAARDGAVRALGPQRGSRGHLERASSDGHRRGARDDRDVGRGLGRERSRAGEKQRERDSGCSHARQDSSPRVRAKRVTPLPRPERLAMFCDVTTLLPKRIWRIDEAFSRHSESRRSVCRLGAH
jgi:hypothetical protein